jgi:SAM-dependent methyltransferase
MDEQTYIGEELDLFAEAINWKLYFSSIIQPYLGKRVLEVGAGLGATTQVLCRGTEFEWICLEPDPKLRAVIDQKIESGQLPKNCKTREGLVATLDVTEQFDTIIYIDVLEHIQNDHSEILSASKLLKRKGKLVILSPAYGFLYSPFDSKIGHYRRYTRQMFKELTPPNCNVLQLLYLDSIGMLTSLSNRLFLQHALPTAKQIHFWDNNLVPVSRLVDPVIRFSMGRSVLCVWEKLDAWQ